MNRISLIFSGILFLFGCITLGIAIICSDVLPKIIGICLITNVISYTDDILQVNSANIYILAFAELILGAFGFFYYRKKG